MRFSTLFNRLLKGLVAVEVYRQKENSEDGEMQGELCGVYSYGDEYREKSGAATLQESGR